MTLYRDELTTLDKYTRLPKPELALQISDWLSGHDIKRFKDELTLERFVANRWDITDKAADRLLNVLMDHQTHHFEPLLVG
jgi:hypothetical protein